MIIRTLILLSLFFAISTTSCKTTDQSSLDISENFVPKSVENIEVYFHPYPEESTFKPIAELISDTDFNRIDIAMYSIEVDPEKSPIIQAIIQQKDRIQKGELKIRMIYQGYTTPCAKCPTLEDLGIDVRQIRSKTIHHKFGVFYGKDKTALMTGSGNWTVSSNTMYDENMLLIRNHPILAAQFISEFQKLWDYYKQAEIRPSSQETDSQYKSWDGYGKDLKISHFDVNRYVKNSQQEPGIEAIFNSDNFSLGSRSARAKSPKLYRLTNQVVQYIDSAKTSIYLASPRLSLRPVYDALKRAAERGIKIKISSTEGAYPHSFYKSLFSCSLANNGSSSQDVDARVLKYAKNRCCSESNGSFVFDAYSESCSTSQNHLRLLDQGRFAGRENIQTRLKLFSWEPSSQSLSQQMHAKFIIVDERHLLAGSFNFSYSSEYNFFENIIYIDGKRYPKTLALMTQKFDRIHNLNRENFSTFKEKFIDAHKTGTKINCPTLLFSLGYDEIEEFLTIHKKYGLFTKPEDVCN